MLRVFFRLNYLGEFQLKPFSTECSAMCPCCQHSSGAEKMLDGKSTSRLYLQLFPLTSSSAKEGGRCCRGELWAWCGEREAEPVTGLLGKQGRQIVKTRWVLLTTKARITIKVVWAAPRIFSPNFLKCFTLHLWAFFFFLAWLYGRWNGWDSIKVVLHFCVSQSHPKVRRKCLSNARSVLGRKQIFSLWNLDSDTV